MQKAEFFISPQAGKCYSAKCASNPPRAVSSMSSPCHVIPLNTRPYPNEHGTR